MWAGQTLKFEEYLNVDSSLHQAARIAGIPFTEELYPFSKKIVSNGLKFHYLEWGNENKETILILHGMGQQSHSWDFISLALASKYRVIALDARGHGDSEWSLDGDYSIEAHQQDLDHFVDTIGLDKFILMGHSMGGRNGYVFASRRPEKVKALVIVDTGITNTSRSVDRIRTFMRLPDVLNSYEEFVSRVVGYTGRSHDMVRGSLKHSLMKLADGRWTWKYDRAIRFPTIKCTIWTPSKLWDCLSRIICPTLLVRGSESDVLEYATYKKILSISSHIHGVTVANASHLVMGDNPKGFLVAVDAFLSSSVGQR